MVMSTDDFLAEYFNDALMIHEIAEKEGLSRDDARILTYIHVKRLKSMSPTATPGPTHHR